MWPTIASRTTRQAGKGFGINPKCFVLELVAPSIFAGSRHAGHDGIAQDQKPAIVLPLTLGLSWSRLNLGATPSRIAFWFLIYSNFATVVAFLMAGVWGTGNSTILLAAGVAHGSDFQEAAVSVVA